MLNYFIFDISLCIQPGRNENAFVPDFRALEGRNLSRGSDAGESSLLFVLMSPDVVKRSLLSEGSFL